MDAFELTPGDGQVARHARADGEHDGVEPADIFGRHVDAESELNTLLRHLSEAALDERLLDLEVGNAEAQETAARLVAFEDRHGMPRTVELLRAREACGPGAYDCDRASGSRRRRLGDDPALVPRAIDDRELDLLDRDGVALLDLEHACRFARCRAEAAGELREVVRAVQLVDRLAEAVAVDEVVPVGDQVSERAAVVAKRNAALHAAGALMLQLDERQRADELAVVADALGRRPLGRVGARELLEAADLAHYATASSVSVSRVKRPWPPADTG